MLKFRLCVLTGTVLLLGACDGSVQSVFGKQSGPITEQEIAELTDGLAAEVGAEVASCIVEGAKVRAAVVGDPEQLNPQEVDLLPVEQWAALEPNYRRIILTQVVVNQAIPDCTINRARD